MRVKLRVLVSTGGKALKVEVLSSPRVEFAARASECAQGQVFLPGRDGLGQPAQGYTEALTIHFSR
jgi:hypothetical protein